MRAALSAFRAFTRSLLRASNPYDVDKVSAGIGGRGGGCVTRMTADEIADANRELAGATPQEILRWAVRAVSPPPADGDRVRGRGVLRHPHARRDRARRSRSSTSRPATSSPRRWNSASASATRYGIEVEYIQPELTVAEYEAEHGGPLHGLRPDQCCHDRKILPLRRARRAASTRWPGSAPSARTRPPTAARPTWCSGTRSSTW